MCLDTILPINLYVYVFQTDTPFLQSGKKNSIPPFNKWIPPHLSYRGLIILPSYILDYNKPWSLVPGRFFSWITSFSRRRPRQISTSTNLCPGLWCGRAKCHWYFKSHGFSGKGLGCARCFGSGGGYGLGGSRKVWGDGPVFFWGWFNGFGVFVFWCLVNIVEFAIF